MYSEPGDVNALGGHFRILLPQDIRWEVNVAVHNTASPETFRTGELIP